jgi:hypothetical protein
MRFRALLLAFVFAAGLAAPVDAATQQTTAPVSRTAKTRKYKAKKRKYKKYKAKKAKRRTTRQRTI